MGTLGGAGAVSGRYETRLAEVCAALDRQGARYVLVGAAALQLWGSTRATRDIGILKALGSANVSIRKIRVFYRQGWQGDYDRPLYEKACNRS